MGLRFPRPGLAPAVAWRTVIRVIVGSRGCFRVAHAFLAITAPAGDSAHDSAHILQPRAPQHRSPRQEILPVKPAPKSLSLYQSWTCPQDRLQSRAKIGSTRPEPSPQKVVPLHIKATRLCATAPGLLLPASSSRVPQPSAHHPVLPWHQDPQDACVWRPPNP